MGRGDGGVWPSAGFSRLGGAETLDLRVEAGRVPNCRESGSARPARLSLPSSCRHCCPWPFTLGALINAESERWKGCGVAFLRLERAHESPGILLGLGGGRGAKFCIADQSPGAAKTLHRTASRRAHSPGPADRERGELPPPWPWRLLGASAVAHTLPDVLIHCPHQPGSFQKAQTVPIYPWNPTQDLTLMNIHEQVSW